MNTIISINDCYQQIKINTDLEEV